MSWIDILNGEQNVSRRRFAKGAAALMGTLVVEDWILNLAAQYVTNQMNLRPLLEDYAIVNSASEGMITRAAKTGELEFTIYDISFGDSKKPLNYEKLKENIEWIFGTLDENIKINLEYKHITPYNPDVFYKRYGLSSEDLNDTASKNRFDEMVKQYAMEFEQLIKNSEVNSIESDPLPLNDYHSDVLRTILVPNIDQYLLKYIDSNDYNKHLRKDKANIAIGDFKSSCAGGASHEILGNDRYILISDDYNGEKSYGQVICHELGHKLGLPHTVIPYDLMSYAPFAGKFGELTGKLGFSKESRKIWSKIKNHFNQS